MSYLDAMKAALYDELQKIAGQMQGYTRIGRRPISVDRLLEREGERSGLPEGFGSGAEEAPVPEQVKQSSAEAAKSLGKGGVVGGSMLGGAALYHLARKANEDRKLGRQVRLQQQG